MASQEVAQQSEMMMEQIGKCSKDGGCMLRPDCYAAMHLFEILVIAGFAMIIVLQNKILKELRKGGKKK